MTSYSPLNKEPWPWQVKRDFIPQDVLYSIENNKELSKEEEKSLTNDIFSESLKKISNYVKQIWDENIIYIFLLIIALGFIHAMWPWHSKSILASYVLDKDKSFLDGFIFAVIFSITHIIDIVIVFIIAKVIFSYFDMWNYIIYIQRVSIILLIILSIYLIYRSIKNINCKIKTSSTKSNIIIWFLAWLAPCTFWWSIFLLLFSLWSFNLIPIFILALYFYVY